MKKLFTLGIIMSVMLIGCSPKNESTTANKSERQKFSEEVEKLISEMSVEEKAGQMTQINLDVIMKGEVYNLEEPHTIDAEKLTKAIATYKVGSILNCGGHGYEIDHWHEIINGIQKAALEEGDRAIPVLYGIDAIHGANYSFGSILFPQQLAQAATWNPEIVKRGAEITAYEVRAAGIPWNFSPVLDLGRQPLWSRFFETYGEDVFLAKAMTEAAITGYEQGDVSQPTAVASCMKHFLGYSFPFTGKDRTPVYLHERQLREYYLPTFQTAVDAGAKTVMINSGELNGVPVHIDEFVLKTLLRDELGFKGLAVTDWEDIMKLYNIHHVASDNKEAVKMAINAGIDMSMVPNDYEFTEALIELINEGEVPMSRVDEAVGRILTLKFELGLFDNPMAPSREEYPKFGGEEHYQAAFDAASESITLLENNGVLPIIKKANVLLTGPAANDLVIQHGAWSRTWQGVDTFIVKEDAMTILEAMQNRSEGKVEYTVGTTLEVRENLSDVRAKAASADVIVVCLGEKPSTEKPGDIDDLSMSAAQLDLVKAAQQTGKPVVLVLVENRPLIVNEVVEDCDAVVMAYQPGTAGGDALAAILYGDVNPSGKLPFTYPRFVNTHITYDHKATEDLDQSFGMNAFNPQWNFGHGLSYSTIEYGELVIDKTQFKKGEALNVSIEVTNSSNHDAKEVVQLYVKDHTASITPSVKRLRGFEKVAIPARETKTVSFTISAEDLAFVGRDLEWVIESGQFSAEIAGQEVSFELID